MGRFGESILADLRAGTAAYKIGGFHRGGALKLLDHTGKHIGSVEGIFEQAEVAALWASAPLLLAALEKAIAEYGKPGGPWNVPSDPGDWLAGARHAVAKAREAA